MKDGKMILDDEKFYKKAEKIKKQKINYINYIEKMARLINYN